MRSSLRRHAIGMHHAVRLLLLGGLVMGSSGPDVRASRFFEVDLTHHRVKGAAPQVNGTLKLDLVSVSVDQPQYWPNEKVHLKILMPGRPGVKLTAALQKRDANRGEVKVELDGQGAAVLVLLDGEQKKLELGEYRVDVKTDDGHAQGSTTFSVVEGTLGALSLAYEFKQVTSADALERAKGAWFMGNAAGAGKRWGNGLNFKNELRVGNQPYDGEVRCVSHCMLSGCNGIVAGEPITVQAVHGEVAGVLDVGGHSGPFQIEFVTPRGSLRYQFEGSSHVERDMVLASGGVSFEHRAGLAPYEGTVQVPGRQIFVESAKSSADPFVVESPIASKGILEVRLAKTVKAPALFVWAPRADGSFEPRSVPLEGALAEGSSLRIDVGGPYSLVTLGGFVEGTFREGWTLAFVPAQMSLAIDAPTEAGPSSTVSVDVAAKGDDGSGVAVSGILEVFDNRVAAKSPFNPLASAIGDSVRSTSSSISSWEDHTGLDRLREAADKDELEEKSVNGLAAQVAADAPAAPAAVAGPPPPAKRMMKMASFGSMGAGRGYGHVAASPVAAKGGEVADSNDDSGPQEEIRQGERKVVFCDLVQTDASGRARVEVQLPPQLGRVTMRFVAVHGLDHAQVEKGLDVSKAASIEAQLPRAVVPGAELRIPVTVTNTLGAPVTAFASGVGIDGRFSKIVGPGVHTLVVPWTPNGDGKVLFELVGPGDKSLDRREVAFQSVASEPVTFSRLTIADGSPIEVAPGETAIVYRGPGALLHGIVMSSVTTMESWFGHSEALSAQVAVRAAILSAISAKILDDEGLAHSMQASLDKVVRALDEAFIDSNGLVRPYPGLPGDPLWSGWTARNLHLAVDLLQADPNLSQALAPTIQTAAQLVARIDAALGPNSDERGYDAQGREVIPVEVDGQVVYRALTDDAVTRWATDRFLPTLHEDERTGELDFSKAYDTFRFLRAFERTGALQYLTEIATAYLLQGDRQRFGELFPKVARGMILAQEPGLIQGPALLGGVYSTPMAMTRFLQLLLAMAHAGPTPCSFDRYEQPIAGPATLRAPDGAVVRIDRGGEVSLLEATNQGKSYGRVRVSSTGISMAGEATLTVTLDPSRDPLEYYAIVAVPTTTAVKQIEDVLSDYKGQLIYGQQAMGGQKMQLLTVPFRGKRELHLVLEGAFPGSAPGAVAIRHVENPQDHGALEIPAVTVED